MWEQWPLIEWDFADHLHIDVSKAVRSESFRWFTVRLMGLLSKQGTRLHGFFNREEVEPTDIP